MAQDQQDRPRWAQDRAKIAQSGPKIAEDAPESVSNRGRWPGCTLDPYFAGPNATEEPNVSYFAGPNAMEEPNVPYFARWKRSGRMVEFQFFQAAPHASRGFEGQDVRWIVKPRGFPGPGRRLERENTRF